MSDELEAMRDDMLASASYWAAQYFKDQKSEFWQDMIQDSVLEDYKTLSLILGHLMTGSYAKSHELLRQHLFSDSQVEDEIRKRRSMAYEAKAEHERTE